MVTTEEGLEPRSVLSDLHDVVDSVFLALDNNEDWGLSGKRPDQYMSDVVADAAICEFLKPLGYGILSEESELLLPENKLFPTVVVDPLDGSSNFALYNDDAAGEDPANAASPMLFSNSIENDDQPSLLVFDLYFPNPSGSCDDERQSLPKFLSTFEVN